MALAMAICLFSLAGIPPLAGFIGKFNLFVAAFSASSDPDERMYQALAVIGVLNSAIGAYYYLKIVVAMYYREQIGVPLAPRLTWPTLSAIGVCSVLTVVLGFWAQPLYSASRASAEALVMHPEPLAVAAAHANPRDSSDTELRKPDEEERAAAARRGLQWAPRGSTKP